MGVALLLFLRLYAWKNEASAYEDAATESSPGLEH